MFWTKIKYVRNTQMSTTLGNITKKTNQASIATSAAVMLFNLWILSCATLPT